MPAFSLKSDNQFITPYDDGQGVFVKTYKGDTNDIKIMRASYCSDEHWGDGVVKICATRNSDYEALEVFGTTIAGDKLRELCKELDAIEEKVGMHVFVNRLGLCIITSFRLSSNKAMRINDYFGWSKYGIEVPRQNLIASSAIWNKFDMFNGETMMDVRGLVRTAGEAEELRRSLEEKNVEMAACRKELEEKNMEMTTWKKDLELTACQKELEWSKKMESLFNKLVEEKEKVNDLMKNQLLSSKSDN